jgi:predicted HTH domain antitoxin
MQIAIDLPNDFVAFQTEPTVRREIATSYALWLYQRGRVTLGKAAELAGLDMYEFMQVCKDNLISVIDISRNDLVEELSGFTTA